MDTSITIKSSLLSNGEFTINKNIVKMLITFFISYKLFKTYIKRLILIPSYKKNKNNLLLNNNEENYQNLNKILKNERKNFNPDYYWRINQLLGLQKMINDNDEIFRKAAEADVGRTNGGWLLEKKSITGDIQLLIDCLDTEMDKKPFNSPIWMQPATSYQINEPLGVALVYGAFNYSTALTILPLAAALAAGNSVVVKPSECAPKQAEVLAKLIPKYCDTRAVQVVCGDAEVSSKLLKSAIWDKVFYTGKIYININFFVHKY